MYLDLIDDPWTLTDHAVSLSDYSNLETVAVVDGRKDPRVVCGDKHIPWFKTSRNKLPAASFPFKSHGEVLSIYYLPAPSKDIHESNFKTQLGVGSETYYVALNNSVRRYTEEMPGTSLEAVVNNWINWSVRIFQEIVSEDKDDYGDDFSGIARRSWKTVNKHVLKDGGKDAIMSLIVQLSNDNKLRDALGSISRTPRKVLERVRQNLKVSRIQQMDGACIREYARRPGYNTATKAGSKQELLALNRVENTDTLENRVYVWVLKAIEKAAHKYVKENSAFTSSERVSGVRQFGIKSKNMRTSPVIEEIPTDGLVHPVQPNYPLQLDRRYKNVYKAYKSLRQDEKVYDDAWEWQRVLWSCSGRLILYSLLQKIFPSPYSKSSFVYIKREGMQGRWLNRSDAPGPFGNKWRQYCYLVDAWDIVHSEEWIGITELFPGAHDIGRLGCDAFLYSPSMKKILFIWFAYGTESGREFQEARLASCQEAMKRFSNDLRRQNKLLSSVDGLIMTSFFEDGAVADLLKLTNPGEPKTYLLMVPHQINRQSSELQNLLKPIVGEFVK